LTKKATRSLAQRDANELSVAPSAIAIFGSSRVSRDSDGSDASS